MTILLWLSWALPGAAAAPREPTVCESGEVKVWLQLLPGLHHCWQEYRDGSRQWWTWPEPHSRAGISNGFWGLHIFTTGLQYPRCTTHSLHLNETSFHLDLPGRWRIQGIKDTVYISPYPGSSWCWRSVHCGGWGHPLSASQVKQGPCVDYSYRLPLAEGNYDVWNRRLLAVKITLAEWRHWLEEPRIPILVWTDHKKCVYLRTAKRLNPRQPRILSCVSDPVQKT